MKTPHPYDNSQTYGLFYESIPALAGMSMRYRFQLDAVDTEGTASAPVETLEVMQNCVVQNSTGGAHRGRVFTPWVVADGGITYVRFTSGPRNCPPEGCLADGGLPDGGSWPYYGVTSTALELLESQSGAKEYDLPLRFPGQYFRPGDAEA